MSHLLRIDASARNSGSHSRELGDAVQAKWRAQNPTGTITQRDLDNDTLELIRPETILGFFTPDQDKTQAIEQSLVLSDTVIAEYQAADTLLITAPMYNFGMPAALKAWIDQVARVNHTFAYDGETFSPLGKIKRAIIAEAYGAEGFLPGGPVNGANFLRPHIQQVLTFLGVETIEFVAVEGTSHDPSASMTQAKSEVEKLSILA